MQAFASPLSQVTSQPAAILEIPTVPARTPHWPTRSVEALLSSPSVSWQLASLALIYMGIQA